MATHDQFTVETGEGITVTDVSDRVRDSVPDDADGTCTVVSQHTTAGIVVNEAEQRLLTDLRDALADLVPDEGWRHDDLDGNADAHVRAMLLGPDATLPVVEGELDLGTWQSVLFVDCDGPRSRTVRVVV